MRQTTKFYLTSFLKNQTYFAPVFIIILQFYRLDFNEIFWVFTIGSIISVLIEIPTGIFADLYGKRRSIILSKFMIFVSYIIFGFAESFWLFVLAQAIFELGNSFRSGTETAYTFDYLKQNKNQPSYTLVKGNQKFYARIGEAIASVLGGLIAKYLGYNMVFFIAAAPAFLNFLLALTWVHIEESNEKVNWKGTVAHTKSALVRLYSEKKLFLVTMNIMIFTSVLAALTKFIQPYMQDAGIPLEWFGVIFAISLALAALSGKYAYLLERWMSKAKIFNYFSLLAFVPLAIIGFGFVSIIGVLLFFIVVIIENMRSPIGNNLFHELVDSKKRATFGSALSLSKSFGKIVLLPVIGFISESWSMYVSLLVLSGILLLNTLLFRIKE